jgi:hypothetical protein
MAIGETVTAGDENFEGEVRYILELVSVTSPELSPIVTWNLRAETVSGDGFDQAITVRVGSPDGDFIDVDMGVIDAGDSVTDDIFPGFTPDDGVIGVAFSPDNDFIPDFVDNSELDYVLNVDTDVPDPGDGNGNGDDPTEPPTQPVDPATYTLPFSGFNALPNASGFEDLTVEIPTADDIGNIVSNNTLREFQVDDVVERNLRAFGLDDVPSLPAIGNEIDTQLRDLEIPSLDDIRAEIDDALAELDLPDVPSLDEIVSGVTDEVDSLIQGAEDALSSLINDVDQTVAAAERELQDAITDVSDDVSDLLDPIDENVSQLVDDVGQVQADLDELEVPEVPTVDEIVDGVVDAVQPEINDVGLFDDPVAFAGQFLVVGIERSLSDETKERLRERADE